jgi:TetR/AcrR family transcriptional repressor of nem operon
MMDLDSSGKGGLTPKGRLMRDRIVEAAADRVFKSGAGDTSLDDVRHEVGASKSQLYHYFSSKDELLGAVIGWQGPRIVDAQQPELASIDSFESLRVWRDKLVQLAETHGKIGGCPIGSLANELAPHDPDHRAALAVQFDHWKEQLEQAFARMQARGALAAGHSPKHLGHLFLTTLQGGLLFVKLQQSSEPLAAALDDLIRLLEADSPAAL